MNIDVHYLYRHLAQILGQLLLAHFWPGVGGFFFRDIVWWIFARQLEFDIIAACCCCYREVIWRRPSRRQRSGRPIHFLVCIWQILYRDKVWWIFLEAIRIWHHGRWLNCYRQVIGSRLSSWQRSRRPLREDDIYSWLYFRFRMKAMARSISFLSSPIEE